MMFQGGVPYSTHSTAAPSHANNTTTAAGCGERIHGIDVESNLHSHSRP